jgi:hypothetical protein
MLEARIKHWHSLETKVIEAKPEKPKVEPPPVKPHPPTMPDRRFRRI